MAESGLKLHSLGIVVEDKPPGTDYILVSPIEELNIQAPGGIKDFKKDYDGSKKELDAANFKTEHEAKNYHRARWLPFGHSNRISAPDVIRNETVIIWKFGNVDEYYWTTIFREPELRRLETVLYGYSNLKDGVTTKSFDKTTSYWLEVSTKDKYIHIHTAKNDGEPFEYDVKIDTKTGFIKMNDDVGNFIELNSPSNAITMRALAMINLDAPIINIRSAGGAMTMNSAGIKAEGNEIKNITTTGERDAAGMAEKIDGSHSKGALDDRQSAPVSDIGLTNKSLSETNIIGDSVVTQATTVSSEISSSVSLDTPTVTMNVPQTNVTGVISVTGDIDATGKIMDGGGNSNHHSH